MLVISMVSKRKYALNLTGLAGQVSTQKRAKNHLAEYDDDDDDDDKNTRSGLLYRLSSAGKGLDFFSRGF